MGYESRNGGARRVLSAVPTVGQPFRIAAIGCPVNAMLVCNCGGAETNVTILASQEAACPSCGKAYNLAFNPLSGKLEVHVRAAPTTSAIDDPGVSA